MVATVYTFQLWTFYPNKTLNKKKNRKCKKHGIKSFLFLYYNQAKFDDIAHKNPNTADIDEQTFNYRWPNKIINLTLAAYIKTFHPFISRGGFRVWFGGCTPPFFNHLFFCDHFEELQTVLIKVKIIINNAPLTQLYPNTIRTFNTQSFVVCQRVIMLF